MSSTVCVTLFAGKADAVRISEAAFFHKRTKTLLVTDGVIYIENDAPEIIPEEVCGVRKGHGEMSDDNWGWGTIARDL